MKILPCNFSRISFKRVALCIAVSGFFDVCVAVNIEDLLASQNGAYRKSVIGSQTRYAVIKQDGIRSISITSEMGVCRFKTDTTFAFQDSTLTLKGMGVASKKIVDFGLNQCFLDSILSAKKLNKRLFAKNRLSLNRKGLLMEDSEVFRVKFLSGGFVFIKALREAVLKGDSSSS